MKHAPLLFLMAFAFPFNASAQTPSPAPTPAPQPPPTASPTAPTSTNATAPTAAPATAPAPAEPDPEVLFLLGLPEDGTDEEIITFTRRLYARTKAISEPSLRMTIRLTLARLEENPKQARALRAEHLVHISECFLALAVDALVKEDVKSAANAIQIAIHSNPANFQARLLFAKLIHLQEGLTDEAINVLQGGLAGLKETNPVASDYLKNYFQLLEVQQRDREVLEIAQAWLRLTGLTTQLRETLATHAATAANWIGDYDTAVDIIRQNGLKNSQARLLEARACFYSGKTAAAIGVLERAAPEFKGGERDAILGQMCRFYSDTGQIELALATAQQRINEFPENSQPYVHRLHLLHLAGRREALLRELKTVLDKFSTQQAAVLALANFASERGYPDIANTCYKIALQNTSDPNRPGLDREAAIRGNDKVMNLNAANWSQQKFNAPVFAALLLESLIRAKRPQDAIATYQHMLAGNRLLFDDSNGTVNALIAAAYLATGDNNTARGYLEAFLEERRNDATTIAKIKEIEDTYYGVKNNKTGEWIKRPIPSDLRKRLEINDEIRRISQRPRKIAAPVYLAVGQLLRGVGASQNAMDILERGVRTFPNDSQLKADCIAVRIVCEKTEEYGNRKALYTEVEELLQMRRPSPKIWTDISLWLDTDKSIPAEQAVKLRSLVAPLVRPELRGTSTL
ncbi:MAG: hypothetical protein LBV28_04755 [Puniceicoccales bacterium]|nr:hypothetical protein [Puniceicoccales bacterium]